MDDAILNFRLGKYSPNRRRESRQVIRAGNENVLHASFFSPLSTVAQYLALSFSPTHIPSTSFFGSSRKVRETNREEPNEHKEETVISVAISKALGNFNLVIESLKFTC